MRGHIRKRGNKWAVIIPVGYDQKTKKTKYKWFSYDTEDEAEKECARLITELNQGTFIEPSKMTVAEYMDFWFENYVESNTRKNTRDSYKYLINLHVKPEIGKLLLNKLQPLHIQQLLTKKSKSGRVDGKSGGLSSRSVKYIYSILREALKHAVKWKLLPQNPAEAVEIPRLTRKRVQVWTPEETRCFLKAAEDDKFYALFVLALFTGMRRGELLALKWQEIDFEKGVIQVNNTLSKQRTLETTKTEKSQRGVLVTENVLDILRQHKLRQLEKRIKVGQKYQDYGLIFCTRLGTPLNAENLVKRHYFPIIEKAGVRKINFHSLRHCSATLALANNVNIKIISERLGHSTIKTTADIYSHVSLEMQRKAAQGIDKVLFAK